MSLLIAGSHRADVQTDFRVVRVLLPLSDPGATLWTPDQPITHDLLVYSNRP